VSEQTIQRQAAAAEEEAAAAAAKAAESTERADELRAQIARERTARLEEWDKRFLEQYDDHELARLESDAYAELREAIAADPVFTAFVKFRIARMRRWHRAHRAGGIAEASGRKRPIVPAAEVGRYIDVVAGGDRGGLLEELANARALDEEEELAAEREAYSAGKTDAR
jgi:hypothetical protein